MEGRTQAIWFLFLCSCPHSRPVGNTGFGDGGQEDGLSWGWHHMLVCAVLQGRCQEESLCDKIRKRKRSQGRREKGDYRRLQLTWFFSKCYVQDSDRIAPFSLWLLANSLHPTPLLFMEAPVLCYLDSWETGLIFIFFPERNLIPFVVFVLRMHFLDISPFLQVALITEIDLVLGGTYTVEWDVKIRDEEKIDCYPDETGVSAENCTARGCAWEVTMLTVLIYMKILYTLFKLKHSGFTMY